MKRKKMVLQKLFVTFTFSLYPYAYSQDTQSGRGKKKFRGAHVGITLGLRQAWGGHNVFP